MIGSKKVVAIIPARAGSKRLNNKNKLPINGVPLVEIAIRSAMRSKYVDKIILSTDDAEIIELCKIFEIRTIERPAKLCTDDATTIDVVCHCIDTERLENQNLIVLLQPTSPLRDTADIDSALELFSKKKAESVLSVAEVDHSPLWCNTLNDEGSMDDFIPADIQSTRSQDLPKFYRLNGAIYIATVELIKQSKKFISDQNSFAFIMSKNHSIDIDDEHDYIVACAISNTDWS